MIVDPALRHLVERMNDHFQIALALGVMIVAQEEFVHAGIGKFRRLPQAAVVRVVGAGDLFAAFADDIRRKILFRRARL